MKILQIKYVSGYLGSPFDDFQADRMRILYECDQVVQLDITHPLPNTEYPNLAIQEIDGLDDEQIKIKLDALDWRMKEARAKEIRARAELRTQKTKKPKWWQLWKR